jgi:hypothetical protein
MRLRVLFAVLVVWCAGTHRPADAAERRCFDLQATHAQITLSGKLTVRLFVRRPSFELTDLGEIEEPALILELPNPICADDGFYIDGTRDFDTVHVGSDLARVLRQLNGLVGRRVTVHGEAFGAFSPRHKAPLILMADRVEAQ